MLFRSRRRTKAAITAPQTATSGDGVDLELDLDLDALAELATAVATAESDEVQGDVDAHVMAMIADLDKSLADLFRTCTFIENALAAAA